LTTHALNHRPQCAPVSRVTVIHDPGFGLSPEASLSRHFCHSCPFLRAITTIRSAAGKILVDSGLMVARVRDSTQK
jgi:hypothetical protein